MEPFELSRRAWLQQAAGLGLLSGIGPRILEASPSPPEWHAEVYRYLMTLARPDGGFAWPDQDDSHLSPTFAVLASLQVLNRPIPNTAATAAFVRTHHPTSWKKLEQEHREFDFQQLQSLLWLEENVDDFRTRVLDWKAPVPYLSQYEKHRFPVFRFQLAAITCRQLLGIPASEIPQAFVDYLLSRQRPNGTFNNTPAKDGTDGHVLNTWWGLEALQAIDQLPQSSERTVRWLQDCQSDDGGFRWSPQPNLGKESDVAYTWAALRALQGLGAKPRDPEGAVKFLISLRNADGGFGDRPGWNSNAMSTRYSVESLACLAALEIKIALPAPSRVHRALPDDLKIYTIQIEAHGKGSPAEVVLLAKELGIDLWGAKNALPGWIERAQAIADEQRIPVKFFVANEEYGTWLDLPGFGTYSHMSDLAAPPNVSIGSALAAPEAVTWEGFRDQRLQALWNGNGQLIWQFGENEELARTVLDDSVERGGYAAISTFHFGNPDFTNSEPFLCRYQGQLPYIALQDAHGQEPWWFADMTTGFRTLFLAHEPTWAGWQQAVKQGWVAAVRKDDHTQHRLRMHCGLSEIRALLQHRQAEWQWWDSPLKRRPDASIVMISADDQFEAPRPDRGALIRVRCAWTNTPQGIPISPLAELKLLRVNGELVYPELYQSRNPKGGRPADQAHLYRIPDISLGTYIVDATVLNLQSQQESTVSATFHV